MVTALIVLIIIVAILLVLVVLAQNSKGGTFASNFSASNQIIGVKKTGDLLEKLTWGFAITLMILCLTVNLVIETPNADAQGGTPATRTKSGPALQTPAPEQQGQAADSNQAPASQQAPAAGDSNSPDPLK